MCNSDERLVRGCVRYHSELTICHVVDGVVPSQERITEKEEILSVRNDSQSTQRAVLILGSIENVIVRVH